MSSPTSHDCRALLVFMTILVECGNFTLEAILAYRVFALFGRRPWVLLLLGGLILAETLCFMPVTFSGFKSYAGGILFQLSPNILTRQYRVFTTLVHSTLISLTVVKHISTIGESGVGRNVISEFTLDGTVSFLMVMGLLGLGFAISTAQDLHPVILFFWALAVHSVCGSRLILNLARTQDRIRGLQEDESILFTTQIDLCLSEDFD
ncbi:hypothetical protein EDC04DRAFT_2605389 [Pisolithus marmoratus]|nr:hypothetical protein EDC04DRAFT_2605389 [Pisolithus marmoratus]